MELIEFFNDIFMYHHHYNQKLINELEQHQKAIPTNTIPLFCHCINAQEIWNARIRNEKAMVGVNEAHPLPQLKKRDKDNYHSILDIIGNIPLNKSILYSNSKGDVFDNTVQEILFHVSNHFSHHKGQIIADFRRSGIAPLPTDYIFYKRS